MGSNGEDECSVFVKVAVGDDIDDFMELPTEADEGLLMSTLQGQFPDAAGLKYKGSSGAWRAVRIVNDTLNAPAGGWGDATYSVTIKKETLKRKAAEAVEAVKASDEPVKKLKKEETKIVIRSDKYLLEDLAIFSLAPTVTAKDIREYFNKNCGEVAFTEVKFDRDTKKSRGFGFIRFKAVEGARKAVEGEHVIKGKQVKVLLKKEDPFKLFVGRIPKEVSDDELKEHFAKYGEISECKIPKGKGFGFVTFLYADEGRAALQKNHVMKGQRLNVQVAEPEEEKNARRRGGKVDDERQREREFLGRERGGNPGNRYGSSDRRDRRDSVNMGFVRAPVDDYARRAPVDDYAIRAPMDDYARDIRDSYDMRDSRDTRNFRDRRDSRDMMDSRDRRGSLNPKSPGKSMKRDRYPPREPIRDDRYGSRDPMPPVDNMQSQLQNALLTLLGSNSY